MKNSTKRTFAISLFLTLFALCSAFAGNAFRTQQIVLVAVVPPTQSQYTYSDDAAQVSASIRDLCVDNGVVIDLAGMSQEKVDEVLHACIEKVADEISRGTFLEGGNAGILIRTGNSQFKVSCEGVSYTAMGSVGQSEIKRIVKTLASDYNIDVRNLAG